MADNRPIGVFDSGIGGLTVLKQIWRSYQMKAQSILETTAEHLTETNPMRR